MKTSQSQSVVNDTLCRIFNVPLVLLLAALFVFSVFTPVSSWASNTTKPVTIAITPCTDIIKTFKLFQPLSHYIEKKIHRPVKLIIPKNFVQFEKLVKEHGVDFAYQAPHTYIRLTENYKKEPLLKALTPEGEPEHRGVLIVRQDSPVKSIEDLKGRVVMFGSELSTAKFLATKALLEKNHISPDKDLDHYVHSGSCESIALNIYLKSADAGAVCDYSFEEINSPEGEEETGIPTGQLRVLAETMQVPTWVFSAGHQTDPKLVKEVFDALLQLDRHREEDEEVLEPAEIGGFVPATDNDFAMVRALAKEEL